MVRHQELVFGLHAQTAARQVGQDLRVMDQGEARIDRALGIDQLGAARIDVRAQQGMDRVRKLEDRRLDRDQRGAIAGSAWASISAAIAAEVPPGKRRSATIATSNGRAIPTSHQALRRRAPALAATPPLRY